MTIIKHLILFSMILMLPTSVLSQPVPPPNFDADIETILHTRHALDDILNYINNHPEVFPDEKLTTERLTSREQRLIIWQTWHRFLDRLLILDEIGQRYKANRSLLDSQPHRHLANTIHYAAFLAQYRYAMAFITAVENDPAMHTILNERVNELGLAKNRYSALKFRFLNVLTGLEFAHLDTRYRFHNKEQQSLLNNAIEQDSKTIWQKGTLEGPIATAENGMQIVEDAGFELFFPLQKNVSEWMGDVKLLRPQRSLISQTQIEEISDILKPGDILLERREWYLSNIGLPGYWPHAALYIGTADERRTHFNTPTINAAYGDYEQHLKQRFPHAYQLSSHSQRHGHHPKVIEAISEGVSFTTLEHSIEADSVVILRPRLPKLAIAQAIERAFLYSGRPYDFNFDFQTDAQLVCTELVYKAYESNQSDTQTSAKPSLQERTGLVFPLQQIMGRSVTTANDMAKMFDDEYGSDNQQLDFIAFYDGHEWDNRAVRSNVDHFRESWKRPKWHIWLQQHEQNTTANPSDIKSPIQHEERP